MAISSGTLTADGSEQTLTTQTAPGVYVLRVNLVNMQAGDIVELRIKSKVLAGDTAALEQFATYNGALVAPAGAVKIIASIPAIIDQYITCALKQTAGTNRQYPWSLNRMGELATTTTTSTSTSTTSTTTTT